MVGVILAALWQYFLLYDRSRSAQLLYAMCLPIVLIAWRATPSETLSVALFTIVPLLMVLRFAGVRLEPANG